MRPRFSASAEIASVEPSLALIFTSTSFHHPASITFRSTNVFKITSAGKSPEEMEPEELEQAMAQAGIQPQPVTAEDQQAMAAAEANDPNADEEVEEQG